MPVLQKATAMNVLFLTSHLPYPPVSGGRLREFELLRRVGLRADVHLCAVSKTFDQDRQLAQDLRGFCANVAVFPAHGSTNGDGPLGRYESPSASAYVRELLAWGDIDAVHAESFYLAQHVPESTATPLLLVEQNVEYTLWRQRFGAAPSFEDRLAALRAYRVVREAERAAWRRSSMVGTVTAEDQAVIRASMPGLDVRVVPDGADHLRGRLDCVSPEARTVVMVANYAYEPNADGAFWFCEQILPRLRARVPDVKIVLVGNEPSAELRLRQDENFVVTGRVPRVEPYLDRAAVVICPLRIGGGIKVKVLEALSRGKALVTTRIGTQGFGEGIGDAVAVADSATAFADRVALLLERPAERGRLEGAARDFARRLPSWDDAANTLLNCYEELAERRRPRRGLASSLARI